MSNKNIENLVIIHNPNSTRSEHFDEQIAHPLWDAGIQYRIHETTSSDFETNVAEMTEDLPEGATVISAAGDGTAAQLANAAARSRNDLTLGHAQLGNFGDIVSTHKAKGQTILDTLAAPTVLSRPMRIEIDGEYWRHSPAYVTLGWTALAAGEFASPELREKVRSASESMKLAKSLGRVASTYFEQWGQKLPAFRVNEGSRVMQDATDILAVNNDIVARIAKANRPYYDSELFGARTNIDVHHLPLATVFGLRAITARMPLVPVQKMRITFEQPSDIPLQSEGEFELLRVGQVDIRKDPDDAIRVLHPKNSPSTRKSVK